MRRFRRAIAKQYAREIGCSTGGGGGFKAFWRDFKAGLIQKSPQFKAIEKTRNKNMREAMRMTKLRRAHARRVTV